jgi:hypothetical protein
MMNRQVHIQEADYEIVSSQLGNAVVDNPNRKLYDAIIGMSEKLFPNRRGQVFTVALTGAGLANNPIDLNRYYLQNATVIDGYFNRINMEALGNAIGDPVGRSIQEQIPALVAGAALGVGISLIVGVIRK